MLQKLEDYLFETYNFRFNVLTEQTEYAPKGSAEYQQADQRVMNTLCIEARTQGINCWDKDISSFGISSKNFRRTLMDKRFPPMDAGHDRPMDEPRRTMYQCCSPSTRQH